MMEINNVEDWQDVHPGKKVPKNNERRFSTSSGITFESSPFRSNKCDMNQNQKLYIFKKTYEDQSEKKSY